MAGTHEGWAWRATGRLTANSRTKRFQYFMELMQPGPDESVLDVGIVDTSWRSGNPLESNYQHLDKVRRSH